jgi:hypothetical protein
MKSESRVMKVVHQTSLLESFRGVILKYEVMLNY